MDSDRSGDPPATVQPTRRLPVIDAQRCTGCGWCVAACELHLLSLQPQRWVKVSVLDQPGRCTGCSACAWKCPVHAIRMQGSVAGIDQTGDRQPPEVSARSSSS